MMVVFGIEPGAPQPPLRTLPEGMILRVWQPARHGFPPRGSRTRDNIAWWLLNRLGVFATDEFTELTVWQGDTRIHRLIVSPRWHRSPFMAGDDLEVGNMWTLPEARGQKLGHIISGEAHRLFDDRERRWWGWTEADNAPSIAIAARCNYRSIGTGYKTRPWGVGLWGQYIFVPKDG
ncbi:MAG: GNAT family N-acetyltransferase [Sphingomonas sp.]|uniref:GNAT family N-acetyltransferase n=1 Tax=Sphingomonas sp. TaxID=28214 RepID=UPI003F7E4E42